MVRIRPYELGDDDAMYDICLRTGDGGEDASALYTDPRLLGELYVGPYLRFEPGLAFVIDDGGVAGYVLGARDTTAFERDCEATWWPDLRRRYPEGSFAADAREARLVTAIHHPPQTDPAIATAYPSHLHIDLLPRAQGRGRGRALIEHLLAALAGAGSTGVHLGVGAANDRAIGFYRRMGFTELKRLPHAVVMGRTVGG